MTVYINGTTGYSGPVGTIGDLTTTGNTTLGDASTDKTTINGKLWSYVDGTTTQQYLSFGDGTTTYSSVGGYRDSSTTGHLEFYTLNAGTLTEGMRLDSSGNLGLGVTPSAWASGKALEVGNAGNAVWGRSAAEIHLAQGYYYNGTNFIRTGTAALTSYQQYTGIHAWFTAPSGTAGTAVSFTQAMTLNASGFLGLNTTNPLYRVTVQNGADLTTPVAVDNQTPNNNYAATMLFNNTGPGSFFIGRASASTGYLASGVGNIGNSNTGIWNSAATKMYFGTNNTTSFYIDTDQAVYFSGTVRTPVLSVYSSVNGSGNMSFQSTGTPSGTGYCGINAYTNSVFGLGSASGTNFPVEFYTNGGLAARVTTGRGNGGYRLVTAGVGLTATGSSYSGGFSAGMSNIGTGSRNNSVIISGNYATGGGFPQFCANWASGGAWGLGPDTGTNDSYLRFGLWGEDADGFYWTGVYNNLKVSTLTQTSDYRIKENVRLYEQDALAVLRLFSPKRFNKIVHQDPSVDEPPVIRDEIGYIAHEVQEHIPELVTGVKDAVDANGTPIIQGMDYDRMGPVLHRAVLQLEDKLIALQESFDAYKQTHP